MQQKKKIKAEDESKSDHDRIYGSIFSETHSELVALKKEFKALNVEI